VAGESRSRVAQAGRDHDAARRGELPERGRIEVVGMGVRDEYRVEVADRRRIRGRPMTPKRPEPAAEDRIGQEADAIELDEERRMAEVRDPGAARARRELVSRC
jgi:hypothetical protein